MSARHQKFAKQIVQIALGKCDNHAFFQKHDLEFLLPDLTRAILEKSDNLCELKTELASHQEDEKKPNRIFLMDLLEKLSVENEATQVMLDSNWFLKTLLDVSEVHPHFVFIWFGMATTTLMNEWQWMKMVDSGHIAHILRLLTRKDDIVKIQCHDNFADLYWVLLKGFQYSEKSARIMSQVVRPYFSDFLQIIPEELTEDVYALVQCQVSIIMELLKQETIYYAKQLEDGGFLGRFDLWREYPDLCAKHGTLGWPLVELGNNIVGMVDTTHYCANPTCTQDVEKLMCGRCKCVRYCSKLCQKTDWKVHKACCRK